MSATPPAGWYPDPASANPQRFWDGTQWTDATAIPALVFAPPAQPGLRGWVQRHPVLTFLLGFWAMCLLWSWPWLPPTLLVAAAVGGAVWWHRRRNTRLAAAADRQNALVLQGDPRGVFGDS